MPTVFVVQEPKPGPKGFTYDITPALSIGVPVFVFDKAAQPGLSPGPSMHHARRILQDFSDEDYILWAGGDPAALAIVSAVAAEMNHGRFGFLRWERERDADSQRTRRGFYIPVKINIRG